MRSARLVLVFVIAALVPSVSITRSATEASAGDILPFKATETTLANGLKVIVVPTGFPNIVSLQIPVQTGSRNEVEPGKSGFAHFFEHILFKGTPTSPPEKFEAIMQAAGARNNASTSDDWTRYYVTFAKDDLEPMIALYGDMFQNLTYTEPVFRTEAGAILGEYNKNSANPLQKLIEVQRARAFTTHTYRHTTMGFLEDIEDMPNQYEYSRLFFERWYRPEYTTLIVAGDVDSATVLPLVEKYWGTWKSGGTKPVDIPKEPAPSGPVYAHVPWSSPTLPWVAVAFRAPAFSETSKDYAAMELVASIQFGPTSELYKRLVVREQKVDQFFVDNAGNVDPALFTIFARVKKADDAVYVRDQILRAASEARTGPVMARRLEDAKSFQRYSLVRTLDSTDRIAALLGAYGHYGRSYQTVNNLFRVVASLTPADLQAVAQTYFLDDGLVVTTLSHGPMPDGVRTAPPLRALAPVPAGHGAAGQPAAGAGSGTSAPIEDPAPRPGADPQALRVIVQKSPLPQLNVKLMFAAGSVCDPPGKEGLSALAADMVAEAGSKRMTIEAINEALYPMAGSFTAQVDKEMVTFTASIHRDNWRRFFDIALFQLLEPGLREEDFTRVKAQLKNALVEDLRASNDEELGKERLQANIFRGTRYGHPALGTVAGIEAITLDDVQRFIGTYFTQARLSVGINGDVPDEAVALIRRRLASLPVGSPAPRDAIAGRQPVGLEVEIIKKDTRSVAISLGHPIAVTRSHPDFAALSVARAWLGEHRESSGRLYQTIRGARGMNYGDYAYIEAFPRGMFQVFPDPNIVRRSQIFEIWIRPVMPEAAHMALRLALHELKRLVDEGLSEADFERSRGYLMKSVYVMTARQGHQIGYALDSQWYGTPEFTSYMRDALGKLTRDAVNAAIRRHWSAENLSVVFIASDAEGLRQRLLADAPSPMRYESDKPAAVVEADKVIGVMRLGLKPGSVTITPVEEVFAR